MSDYPTSPLTATHTLCVNDHFFSSNTRSFSRTKLKKKDQHAECRFQIIEKED